MSQNREYNAIQACQIMCGHNYKETSRLTLKIVGRSRKCRKSYVKWASARLGIHGSSRQLGTGALEVPMSSTTPLWVSETGGSHAELLCIQTAD